MNERKVTFKGTTLHLEGTEVKVGDKAPNAEVIDLNMKDVNIFDFKGKVTIISSVVSLDTPTCQKETHRFNQEAQRLGKNVSILTISMDLPFAQKRWCGAVDNNQVHVVSDYKFADFGEKFGVMISEWRLLARAVFVLDKEGVIRHIEYVKEVSAEPNYDAILRETEKLLKEESVAKM